MDEKVSFFKRKDIEISFQRYVLDALSAMTRSEEHTSELQSQ